MLIESATALALAGAASAFILGMERKIQARIQGRRGPSLAMPGFWSAVKFAYKDKPKADSPNETLYCLFLAAATCALAFMLLFTTPQWSGILGFATLLGLAGLLKVEEVTYLFMGSFSRSVMSAGMPFPDNIRGSKEAGTRSYFEDVAAVRALKMITFGSFPYYIALTLPFAAAHSLYVSDVLASKPAILTLSGLISAIVYFAGYNILINNRPFDIVKPKVDIIEGPMMEYAAGWRALSYVMRGLAMFTLSSVFVTLYLGVPFDVADMPAAWAHLALALVLPALAAILKAFSPVLTFRQIYPISYALTLAGIAALALNHIGT
jgi:energy-converting hydrogenase B subunit O